MTKTVLFLLGISFAAGGVIHPLPDPYRWDESFTVKNPLLDDEHRGLFNGILKIAADNTDANLKAAGVKFLDHFTMEEKEFEKTMSLQYTDDHKAKHNSFIARFKTWSAPVPASEIAWGKNWLVQHIKNTDFKYIDQLPYQIPHPYTWDDSFEVFYTRLDEEHQGLFDAVRKVGEHPTSTKDLDDLKAKLRAHFDYERGIFCDSVAYTGCEAHSEKHDRFFKQVNVVSTPVSQEVVTFAKNWLVQHIKNSDFAYKHKLNTYKHEVPSPYYWNPTFSVFYDQLDSEHQGLFDGVRESTDNPADAAKYENLKQLLKAHFDYEEAEFSAIPGHEDYAADHIAKHNALLKAANAASVPLDCDFIEYVVAWLVNHIKNTDFAYRHKLVHDIPAPYVWDESFMVFYKKLDDEHKVLFDCVNDCVSHPADADKYAFCKTKLRRHFDSEEMEFCAVPNYDCYGHYLKHYNFQIKFQGAGLPLTAEVANFAKSWLVHHIKNTDFAYKGKLLSRRHYAIPTPFVWDESFIVDVKALDDEHVGLFDAVAAVEADKGSKTALDQMFKVFDEHFVNEEALFTTITDADFDPADHRNRHLALMKTVSGAVLPITEEMTEFLKNWLTQHIKNSDFKYKNKMPKHHPVPEPFKWSAYFAVYYPDMDTEHKGLFSCLHDIETDPGNVDVAAACIKKFEEHFHHEEEQMAEGQIDAEDLFQHKNKHAAILATAHGLSIPVDQKWIDFAKNWLSQHIPNTDFKYKNKMPFPVSHPLTWDESFEVFYTKLDDQHKGLFDALQKLKDNNNDVDVLNYNRDVFRDHFDYEEKQFMACGEKCDADAHKKKHDIVFKTLTWVTPPVSVEYADFAMNWLVQHIKNSDFAYKHKLPTKHDVPAPFVWNSDFEVNYQELDDEHVGLFKGIHDVELDLNSQEKVDTLSDLLREHFYNEEARFCDAINLPWDYCKMHKERHSAFSKTFSKVHAPVALTDVRWAQNWLVQHIRNTDFGYKGSLKHEIPDPYVWDTSFAVDYSRLDEEHDGLFAAIAAVSQSPNDAAKLQDLKDKCKAHFVFEEQRFCSVPNFNCIDHKMKHYKFFLVLEDLQSPVNCDTIIFAKNWLTQHIKNTDHVYKLRLGGPDSGATFSGI